MSKKNSHKVSIVMGSQSDFRVIKICQKILKKLKIKYETKIISAHRTPYRMYEYAKNAEKNNIAVIIAGAWFGTLARNDFCNHILTSFRSSY